jgi:hypothetical protein
MAHKKHKRFYAPTPAAPMQKRASEPREYTYFSPAPTSLWSGRGASTRNAYLTPSEVPYVRKLQQNPRFLRNRNANRNNVRRLPPQLYMPQSAMRPSLSRQSYIPQRPLLCHSRDLRRRILFALQRTGAGAGSQRRPIWTKDSYISCK